MAEFPRIEEIRGCTGKYWEVVYKGYSTPFLAQWDAIKFAAGMNLPKAQTAEAV